LIAVTSPAEESWIETEIRSPAFMNSTFDGSGVNVAAVAVRRVGWRLRDAGLGEEREARPLLADAVEAHVVVRLREAVRQSRRPPSRRTTASACTTYRRGTASSPAGRAGAPGTRCRRGCRPIRRGRFRALLDVRVRVRAARVPGRGVARRLAERHPKPERDVLLEAPRPSRAVLRRQRRRLVRKPQPPRVGVPRARQVRIEQDRRLVPHVVAS
jgi:hypothetical protein